MSADPIDPAQRIVDLLNEVLAVEPGALRAMLAGRFGLTTDRLDAHPTLQVRMRSDGFRSFGVLGLLNGLLPVGHPVRVAVMLEPDEPSTADQKEPYTYEQMRIVHFQVIDALANNQPLLPFETTETP